jgi:hypothetical protein
MTNQQTHHVLGHELVHAFQYHMVLDGDSTNMQQYGEPAALDGGRPG